MDLEKAIRTRRTHKAYGPRELDPGMIEELVELARWAPGHPTTTSPTPGASAFSGPGRGPG